MVRAALAVVNWLDAVVLLLLLAAGAALAAVVLIDGGTAIEVALVILLTLAAALRWAQTSFAMDNVRDYRDRMRADR